MKLLLEGNDIDCDLSAPLTEDSKSKFQNEKISQVMDIMERYKTHFAERLEVHFGKGLVDQYYEAVEVAKAEKELFLDSMKKYKDKISELENEIVQSCLETEEEVLETALSMV